MEKALRDFTAFGALGDGVTDNAPAFARALTACKESGEALAIPVGLYRVTETVRVPSGMTIVAERGARIRLDGERKRKRGEFLLANDDPAHGNADITVIGGVWDGGQDNPANDKPDLFDTDGYSGACLNFVNVKGLVLRDVTVANTVTYFVRMGNVDGFVIENIAFVSDRPAYNQDGLHFGGGCRNGAVCGVTALSRGQTNDDLLAFNADDCVTRVENYDLARSAIENITVKNVFAEDCHTLIRLLSVTSPIRHIRISDVYGGYRCYAINADGARYCRTPLFKEEDCPGGCGAIEDVVIERLCCHATSGKWDNPAVCLEENADGLVIGGFRHSRAADDKRPAFMARNVAGLAVTADGEKTVIRDKSETLVKEDFTTLAVEKV